MDITITISEKTGKIIRERAESLDMGLAGLASDLLESKGKSRTE